MACRTRNCVLLSLALIPLLSACKPPERAQVVGPADESPAAPVLVTKVFGVGDVEFDTDTVTTIDTSHAAMAQPNVRLKDFVSARDRITRVTAEIFPPHPDEVWVKVSVSCRKVYPDHAILMKTRVFVDRKEVESFAFITGDNAREPVSRTLEVLQYFDQRPESFIVHAETDVVLYKNTDETTLTTETAPEPEPGSTATVLGNPLRVDFRS